MLRLERLIYSEAEFTLAADLALEAGTRYAVIGPSGAGKSTLLNLVAGFLDPQDGRLLWQGTDLTGMPPGRRPCAMLFQDNNLFPHLTAEQNAGLGLDPGLRLGAEDRDRVATALDRVGLSGLGARKPAQLSGGQQSRVALARLILQNRPIMLLDEPFSALGPALKAEMLDLVAEVADGIGALLLMVTHDPEDARRIAPQTVLVAGGQAHPPRDTVPLLETPPPELRDYLG